MTEPLILTVVQRGKPGVYVGKIEGTGLSVRASRTPMLDTARALLLVGAPPETVLKMRYQDSAIDRLSGKIGQIVRKGAKKGPKLVIRPFYDRGKASG